MARVLVEDVSDEELGGAFDKRKAVVRPTVDKWKHHEIKLVIKQAYVGNRDIFGGERLDMSGARRYYERWKYLKSVGIQSSHSMRVVGERYIAMGDMTLGGSAFFGKAKTCDLFSEEFAGVKRKLSPIEEVFMSINPDLIKKDLEYIRKIAEGEKIMLPADDPFDLLVHPNGSWEVMVLDLTNMIHEKIQNRNYLESRIDTVRDLLKEIKAQ